LGTHAVFSNNDVFVMFFLCMRFNMAFGKALFADRELSLELHNHISSLENLVARRYQGPHETLTDEQIAVGIAQEAAFQPLLVDLENPVPAVAPIQVQISDYGKLIKVAGVRASYRYEFTGDPRLFFLTPNWWGGEPPSGELRGQSITIGFDSDSDDPDVVKRELEMRHDLFKEYLKYQEKQIAQHNQELVQHVRQHVGVRRRSLDGLKKLREAL
jgi:hypothetical protein